MNGKTHYQIYHWFYFGYYWTHRWVDPGLSRLDIRDSRLDHSCRLFASCKKIVAVGKEEICQKPKGQREIRMNSLILIQIKGIDSFFYDIFTVKKHILRLDAEMYVFYGK